MKIQRKPTPAGRTFDAIQFLGDPSVAPVWIFKCPEEKVRGGPAIPEHWRCGGESHGGSYGSGSSKLEIGDYLYHNGRSVCLIDTDYFEREWQVVAEDCHKLDTSEQVFFYEQDFYVLSNFSSFTLMWKGLRFDTSEAAYHWEKFPGQSDLQAAILTAPSAHEAFKVAESNKSSRHPDWDLVKVSIMRDILRAKATQHEYVKRKLLATGDRELIEDSWRDAYWGWGPNKNGKNVLGRLWMEVRAELRNG